MKMAQSRAHIAATERYNKKAYDRILLKLRKDADINGDAIHAHAEAQGESLNGFLLRAVTEAIQHDRAKTVDKEE